MSDLMNEAFQALKILDEDTFTINADGSADLKNFMDNDIHDELELIIDPLAETEEDVQESYLGKAILDCIICHSKVYKEPEEVVIDEEAGLANVGETCVYCQASDGYKVIGQVAEFCPHCDEEPKVVADTDVSVDVEEKLAEARDGARLGKNYKLKKNLKEHLFHAKPGKYVNTEDSNDYLVIGSNGRVVETSVGEIINDGFGVKINNTKYIIDDYKYGYIAVYSYTDSKVDTQFPFIFKWKDQLEENSIKEIKEDFNSEKLKEPGTALWTGNKCSAEAEALVAYDAFDSTYVYDIDEFREYFEEDVLDNINAKLTPEEITNLMEELCDKYEWIVSMDPRERNEAARDLRNHLRSIKNNRKNMKESSKVMKEKADSDRDYKLKEDLESIAIETDTDKITITSEEREDDDKEEEAEEEKAESAEEAQPEMIEPVAAETEDKFQDVDIDEFDETEFDELGESYLKRVYENVKSYKTVKAATNGNKLKLEGIITFKSGKQGRTNFVFEAKSITKSGKLKFLGENKQFARGKKAFTLTGKANGKKLCCESLTYNYRARDEKNGQSKRLYGRVCR